MAGVSPGERLEGYAAACSAWLLAGSRERQDYIHVSTSLGHENEFQKRLSDYRTAGNQAQFRSLTVPGHRWCLGKMGWAGGKVFQPESLLD